MANLLTHAYAGGVRAVERAFPGPARLGAPLTPSPGPAGPDESAPAGAKASDGAAPSVAQAVTQAAAGAATVRDPVILVHGFGCSPKTWSTWERSMRADGLEPITFPIPDDNMGDVRVGAAALGKVIDRVTSERNIPKVDVVGFSYGGMVARWYAEEDGGAAKIDSLVTVATPHHGSKVATALGGSLKGRIAQRVLPDGVRQLRPDSPEVRTLAANESAGETAGGNGVRYTSIFAPGFDLFVLPQESSRVAGARNVELTAQASIAGWKALPNHYSIVHRNHEAYEAARDAIQTPRPPA